MEIRGKYNTAVVFTDVIEQEAISQIMQLCNLEWAQKSVIRIMPDVHAGKGCTIGTTMTIKDKVCVNLVGVDIGCGVNCYSFLHKEKFASTFDPQILDNVIRSEIPSGKSTHESTKIVSKYIKYDPRFNKLAKSLKNIKAPINEEYALKSLGTLGGGNHFIEVDKSLNKDEDLHLVIHSGSRHLGKEICEHYNKLAQNHNTEFDEFKRKLIERLKNENKQHLIAEELIKLKEQFQTKIPKELSYIQGEDFQNYINDMKIAQEYAACNRNLIFSQIYNALYLRDHYSSIETMHNYIDTTSMILRKGAVSAKYGETLIIPLNMQAGSLICQGRGNQNWNYSAPHGAGRSLSRSQAKDLIELDDYKSIMKEVWTSCINTSTIDESPFAYKSPEDIISNISDTVTILERIIPIYNFKASES